VGGPEASAAARAAWRLVIEACVSAGALRTCSSRPQAGQIVSELEERVSDIE
jgi:hypothetical protein